MEHWGTNQNYVSSATHTPSSFGGTINTAGQSISTVSTGFHVYEMEWTPDELIFSVDGNVHFVYNPEVKNADTWPFDANQYLLLNVAILPSISPGFTESAMEIDYVRVYQTGAAAIEENGIQTELSLFPNPVENMISMELPEGVGKNIQLIVSDMQGRQIENFAQKITDGKEVIQGLEELVSGRYVVTLFSNGKTYSGKFTKR